MRRLALLATAVVALAACTAACTATPGADSADHTTAGMGVPQQFPAEEFPGERQQVRARVHLAGNGCFLGTLTRPATTGRHLVVWPAGTEQADSGEELRLPDGTLVGDRDVVAGTGLLMPTRRLEGFGGDSFWDFAVGFCTPEASEVLVLDSVAPA